MSKTIAIIDDDKAIREMVKSVLEIEGYSVVTGSNGIEGISLIRDTPGVSLILLDMMMPVLSGWGFLDFLREFPETAGIPVVVISAYDEIARSVHPKAIVSKPVQLSQLLHAVASHAA